MERQFDYVLNVSLTASQRLDNQPLPLQGDAPFAVRALVATSTGSFRLRIKTPQNDYMSNELVNSPNIVGTGQFPAPVFPEIVFPRTGVISVDLEDTSGAPNTIQLVFKGAKRFE